MSPLGSGCVKPSMSQMGKQIQSVERSTVERADLCREAKTRDCVAGAEQLCWPLDNFFPPAVEAPKGPVCTCHGSHKIP